MYTLSRRFLLLLVITLITLQTYSQGIKGRVMDEKNHPVPYPVVYDETTRTGVTGNAEGYYELSLPPGDHALVFKAMGYHSVNRNISTTRFYHTINITLKEQPVEIAAVIVRPDKEDPAYPIMRKAISLAPYHLNQIKEYLAEVYLRGTIHIEKIPKIIAKNLEIDGQKNLIKSGSVFIEESMNEITFRAPDVFEQEVLSYYNTYPINVEGVSPAWIISSSLYQNEFEEIISPLASNAFSFYKYRYEGFFYDNNSVVYKIQVIPKRNSQQLMRGYIYIVDKTWSLHSVDATLNMFFGTMSYKTLYTPVEESVWLPISYQFYLDAKIMGISGNYNYSASVKYKDIVINEEIAVEIAVEPAEVHAAEPEQSIPETKELSKKEQKDQEKINSLMAKEDLTNRDMVKLATLMAKETSQDTIETRSLEIEDTENEVTLRDNALTKDTAYWNSIRPIPLTAIEAQLAVPAPDEENPATDRDSLQAADSVVTASLGTQVGKFPGFLLFGKEFRAFDSTMSIRYHGVIGFNKVDFNTVDGFIYRQTFSLQQRINTSHTLKIDPGIAYAFNRERVMWWTNISYDYAPMHGGKLEFYIGSRSSDYNPETGINEHINSLASLFFRRNYLKLYHQNKISLYNRIDLANGLNLKTTFGYQTAQPLNNSSDYSFFYQTERNYSPNLPLTDPVYADKNLYHEEAYWEIGLEYTPRYYYRISEGEKHYQYSKFPTLYLTNRMAVPNVIHSSADYDLLQIGIRQEIEWPIMHAFYYDIKGGFFLNRNKIYLMNYKYFNNQDIPINFAMDDPVFHLMPYYRNATSNHFLEAHVRYTTPYLIVKYLPFISDKLWRENLHLNYLKTKEYPNYWEIGYSVSQIYLMGSVGVFAGFQGSSFDLYGIQVSFDL